MGINSNSPSPGSGKLRLSRLESTKSLMGNSQKEDFSASIKDRINGSLKQKFIMEKFKSKLKLNIK